MSIMRSLLQFGKNITRSGFNIIDICLDVDNLSTTMHSTCTINYYNSCEKNTRSVHLICLFRCDWKIVQEINMLNIRCQQHIKGNTGFKKLCQKWNS